jgi:hypothetical protein
MHRQYKLNQQAAQTGPLMTALVRIEGHVRLSPLVSHRSSVTARQSSPLVSAQERRNRGVLKGRCIMRCIDALKEEVDATKACGYRARRGLDKNQLIPQKTTRSRRAEAGFT